jgi:ABC-type glycerol-3-phosphate transport system permease component
MASTALTTTTDTVKTQHSVRQRLPGLTGRAAVYLFLTVGAILAFFPFAWMLMTSLETYQETALKVWWPAVPQWANYPMAWQQAPFARYFFNTSLVAVLTVGGVLVTSTLAAYAFARMEFFGKRVLFILFLTTLMIPFEILLIPDYLIIVRLKWANTYMALTIPWMASAFQIFLLRQFFATIPKDLYDAAILDGAGHLSFLRLIVIPLSRPALVTVTLFAFLGTWKALLWPLIVTKDESMRVIEVGMASYVGEAGTQTQLLMAAAVFTILPIVVLYFLGQKQFIEGIATSGLKG